MSWQSYVDQMIQSKATSAGLFGQEGNVWAQTPENWCSCDEAACAVKCLKKNDRDVYGNGLQFAGKKWTVILMENDILVLRGKGSDNNLSLVLGLLATGFLAACADAEKLTAQNLRGVIEHYQDYLKKAGY